VGPTCRRLPHPHTRNLSRCPAGPACQPGRPFTRPPSLTGGSHLSDPSPPNRPRTARASSWTPCPRCTSWPRPSPPWPFLAAQHLLALLFPHSHTSVPTSHRVHAKGVSPPLAVVSRPFYGRHRALTAPVASVSSALSPTTQDTPRFVLSPSSSLGPRSPVHCCSSAAVDPCPHRAPDAVRVFLSLTSR
jgi:hypothetical protein